MSRAVKWPYPAVGLASTLTLPTARTAIFYPNDLQPANAWRDSARGDGGRRAGRCRRLARDIISASAGAVWWMPREPSALHHRWRYRGRAVIRQSVRQRAPGWRPVGRGGRPHTADALLSNEPRPGY